MLDSYNESLPPQFFFHQQYDKRVVFVIFRTYSVLLQSGVADARFLAYKRFFVALCLYSVFFLFYFFFNNIFNARYCVEYILIVGYRFFLRTFTKRLVKYASSLFFFITRIYDVIITGFSGCVHFRAESLGVFCNIIRRYLR